MSRAVAITGLGVVAPGGVGTKAYWELLTSGRTATRTITHFDPSPFRSRVGAEVDFDPIKAGLSHQDARRMDRASQFAVVCAREALADSGLDVESLDPGRVGTTIATAVGCTTSLEREYVVVSDTGTKWEVDHEYVVPELYRHFVPSSVAAEVAWAAGAQGPASIVSTGCTSGLDALGYAVDLIREGSVDVVVASRRSPPPASTRSTPRLRATTTPNTPAARSTAPATAWCSARARRC